MKQLWSQEDNEENMEGDVQPVGRFYDCHACGQKIW